MSQENVDVVREVWQAYVSGDFEHIRTLSDPHVVVVSLEDGPAYGIEAVGVHHERWREAWKESETTVEEVLDVGDHVFVMATFRARGRASGVDVEGRHFEVYTLRNRKILHVEEFGDRASALEAAGLQE